MASLSYRQTLELMARLKKEGVRILIIEGGEPLMWRDGDLSVADVVKEAVKLFWCVGITTNGTFPIAVGSDVVWVSVDGLRETHDSIRGTSFDRIVANIEASTHPRVFAHMTINSRNWLEVRELVGFLAPRVKGITVQFHYPYDGVDDGLLLEKEQRTAALDELIRLKREGLPVADSEACLEALKSNDWRCRPWMIANVDPDGSLTHGCYVKGRGEVACENCGFAAHTELSLVYGGSPGAMRAGMRIFGT